MYIDRGFDLADSLGVGKPTGKSRAVGRALVAVFATIGAVLGLGAPPVAADVGPMLASLTIWGKDTRLCRAVQRLVETSVLVQMPEEEARRTGHLYSFRLQGRGDDWSDNKEFGPFVEKPIRAEPGGIRMISKRCVSLGDLNEDPFKTDDDEIFVKVTLLNSSGAEIKQVNTNTVHKKYDCWGDSEITCDGP